MLEPELPNELEPEITPDRSVFRFALIMGAIILILILVSIFMEDIRRAFSPASAPVTVVQENSSQLLNESAAMNEEEVKFSLIKFIEAFLWIKKRGISIRPVTLTPLQRLITTIISSLISV